MSMPNGDMRCSRRGQRPGRDTACNVDTVDVPVTTAAGSTCGKAVARPARRQPDWRQRQRRHPSDPTRPSRATHARQARSAPAPPRRGTGRPRLRPRHIPPPDPAPRREAADRLPRYRARLLKLGTQRWVVERVFARLHWFRRLRIRWEIPDDIHEAFRTLGCALTCWRRLKSLRQKSLLEAPAATTPGSCGIAPPARTRLSRRQLLLMAHWRVALRISSSRSRSPVSVCAPLRRPRPINC